LKQFPHGWNHKIMHIFSQEFEKHFVDHIVYFKRVQKNSHVIIILDDDDLILAFNDLILLKEKKDNLLKKFEMLDSCEILYFLGLEVNHILQDWVIYLNQNKYIWNILKQFGMVASKPTWIPFMTSHLKWCKSTI